jgi:hypothetical protein
MSDPVKSIRIGTMTKASPGHADEGVRKLVDRGFESFEAIFLRTTNGQDLAELGKGCP